MRRADFWVRVIGWLLIAAGVVVALTLLLAVKLMQHWLLPPEAASLIPGLLFLLIGLPQLVSGALMLRYATLVQAEREGRAVGEQAVMRVVLGLAGLWSAGVIGLFGLAAPHLGIVTLFGLASTVVAALGPRATAELIKPGA